jgi:hypothetical protein
LKTTAIDYLKREMTLSLDIWVGDLGAPSSVEREAYRSAEVRLTGLIYYVGEPPDTRYQYDQYGSIRIDVGSLSLLKRPPMMNLPSVEKPAFANWIYVSDWNAFIYVAAQAAHLRWENSAD